VAPGLREDSARCFGKFVGNLNFRNTFNEDVFEVFDDGFEFSRKFFKFFFFRFTEFETFFTNVFEGEFFVVFAESADGVFVNGFREKEDIIASFDETFEKRRGFDGFESFTTEVKDFFLSFFSFFRRIVPRR